MSDESRTTSSVRRPDGDVVAEPARVSSQPLPTIDLATDEDRLDAPSGLLPSPMRVFRLLRPHRSREAAQAHDAP